MSMGTKQKKKYHYFDLFKDAALRKYTLIIGFGL